MRRVALFSLLVACVSGCRRDASAEGFVAVDAGAVSVEDPPAVEVEPAPAAPPPAPRAVLYPADREQSPITPAVAANLRAIAERAPQNDRVFAKLGDSITDSRAFLDCFAGSKVDLGGRDELADTLAWFRASRVLGGSVFTRDSLAAITGWAARGPIGGRPSALEKEVATISPRYAVVMFGTNDVDYRRIDQFGDDMWTIVDQLIARGVIPVMSTIPPVEHAPEPAARVPLFNRVVRALAEGRQVPLIDLHRAFLELPGHGLRPDGVHPNTPSSLGPCNFSRAGLRYGYDVRNLLTLEALDRTRAALAGDVPDVDAPARTGAGTAADPYVIDELPFAHLADTRAGESHIDAYECQTDHDESGPEIVYHLDLAEKARVRIRAVSRDGTDVDIHILESGICVDRADKNIRTTLGPGPVDLVIDSYVDHAGGVHAGEFLLIVERL